MAGNDGSSSPPKKAAAPETPSTTEPGELDWGTKSMLHILDSAYDDQLMLRRGAQDGLTNMSQSVEYYLEARNTCMRFADPDEMSRFANLKDDEAAFLFGMLPRLEKADKFYHAKLGEAVRKQQDVDRQLKEQGISRGDANLSSAVWSKQDLHLVRRALKIVPVAAAESRHVGKMLRERVGPARARRKELNRMKNLVARLDALGSKARKLNIWMQQLLPSSAVRAKLTPEYTEADQQVTKFENENPDVSRDALNTLEKADWDGLLFAPPAQEMAIDLVRKTLDMVLERREERDAEFTSSSEEISTPVDEDQAVPFKQVVKSDAEVNPILVDPEEDVYIYFSD